MFKWYKFADGYQCCVKGLSKMELKREEIKHGKLVSVQMAQAGGGARLFAFLTT